jgi:hypothetical protein
MHRRNLLLLLLSGLASASAFSPVLATCPRRALNCATTTPRTRSTSCGALHLTARKRGLDVLRWISRYFNPSVVTLHPLPAISSVPRKQVSMDAGLRTMIVELAREEPKDDQSMHLLLSSCYEAPSRPLSLSLSTTFLDEASSARALLDVALSYEALANVKNAKALEKRPANNQSLNPPPCLSV